MTFTTDLYTLYCILLKTRNSHHLFVNIKKRDAKNIYFLNYRHLPTRTARFKSWIAVYPLRNKFSFRTRCISQLATRIKPHFQSKEKFIPRSPSPFCLLGNTGTLYYNTFMPSRILKMEIEYFQFLQSHCVSRAGLSRRDVILFAGRGRERHRTATV